MSAALGALGFLGKTNPWMLGAQVGISGLQALFGNRQQHQNFRNPNIQPFNFNPDPNDPEIALRRRAALLDTQRAHASTINEIGRAGLLGSSAAFGLLNQDQTQSAAALEDIPNSVYARQRQDALGLYRDDANFKRSLALNDQGYEQEYNQQSHTAGLNALGGIGDFIGSSFINPDDQAKIALRKRALYSGGHY